MPALDEFMKQLSKEMELEEPLNAEMTGVYVLPLEEGPSLVITRTERGLSFTSTVADCPTIKRAEFLQIMMESNLFGQGTGNAILGLDNKGKQITLSHHIEYDIGYNEFTEILEDFINYVDFWRDEAQNFK
jgi:hypothetical protein